MIDFIRFFLYYIILPIVLSVLYSKNAKKQNKNYRVTKGVYYLVNATALSVAFFTGYDLDYYISGMTIMIAIFEGLPLILAPIFNKNE